MTKFLKSLTRTSAVAGIVSVSVLTLTVVVLAVTITALNTDETVYSGASDGTCNVAVIPIIDYITTSDAGTWEDVDFENIGATSADRVVSRIRTAQYDSSILGVMLRIDSGGGEPVASEVIMDAMLDLSKPSAALIRSIGASGAYLAATGADTIIASRFSDVGGIGVNASYLDVSESNAVNGIHYVQLTSAPFKDLGTPEREITEEERALIEQSLGIYHEVFVEEVSKNRNISAEEINVIANGATVPGDTALEKGLIDQTGNEQTAREWFAKMLNIDTNDVIFCRG